MKEFPNGFKSWQETHYEIVSAIDNEWRKENPQGVVLERQEAYGHGGLYLLAEELTDEFERKYDSEHWQFNDYFETIEKFIQEKLY